MKFTSQRRARFLLACLLGASLLASCSMLLAPEPTATPSPIPPTDTPVPPTNTPQPTATETPEPIPSDTPEPTATPTEAPTETPDLVGTAAAESTAVAEAAQAAVADQLAVYGFSPDSGHLAWWDPDTIPLLNTGYGTLIYEPIDEGEVYNTYLLHTDITWSSETGLAGCGIMFHSEANLNQGEQYRFYMLRFSGLPLWDVELWRYGDWQSTTTGETKTNSAIDLADGATNKIVLAVRDGVMTAYVNEIRLSNVIISTRSEGRIAFFSFQESGFTTCIFANNWIWLLEE